MMTVAATCAKPIVAASALKPRSFTGLKPLPAVFSKSPLQQKSLAIQEPINSNRRSSIVVKAVEMEVAQIAGEAGFIFGVASVMFGITLVGLVFGFVLLRVESLAEEGKI